MWNAATDEHIGDGDKWFTAGNCHHNAATTTTTMLAHSSMSNEEWGIWRQGISCEENRQEKRDQ